MQRPISKPNRTNRLPLSLACVLALLFLSCSSTTLLASPFGPPQLTYQSILTDSERSIHEIIAEPDASWQPLTDDIHSSNLIERTYRNQSDEGNLWVRIKLPRRSSVEQVWLELSPNVGLDGRLAQYIDERWTWFQAEGLEPQNDVRHPVNFLTFKVDLNGEKKVAYLKLSTSLAFHFKINVVTQNELLWHAVVNNLFNGFLLGFFFLAIIYNFAVGISAGERVYLYYAFYVSCNALYITTISGYLRLLFPEWGSMGNMGNLGATLVLFSGTVFVRDFLSTKTYAPNLDWLLKGMQYALFLSLLFITFMQDSTALLLVVIIGSIGPALVIAAGIVCYRNKHPYAGYFLVAWALFVASILIWVAMWLGLLPPTLFVTHVFKIGSILEITLLSLVLAYRYSFLKEQTQELNESKLAFRALSETDELTGVLNRRGFLKYADELVNLRTVERVWLALDIDHFKEFNDIHGHMAGDQLLAKFGTALNAMQRKEDLTAKLLSNDVNHEQRRAITGRIGGEEFALLFTDCSLVQGKHYAEQLLEAFRNISVSNDKGNPVGSTLSIGTTVIRPEDSLETVWKRADKLLYQAKDKGRNQVITG